MKNVLVKVGMSKKEIKDNFLKNLIIKKDKNSYVIQFYFSEQLLNIYDPKIIENYKDFEIFVKMYSLIDNIVPSIDMKNINMEESSIELTVNENDLLIKEKNKFNSSIHNLILNNIEKEKYEILFINNKFISFKLKNINNLDTYIDKIIDTFYLFLDEYMESFIHIDRYYELDLFFRKDKYESFVKFALIKNKVKISISNKNKLINDTILRNTLNRLNFIAEFHNSRILKNKYLFINSERKNQNNIFIKLNRALFLGFTDNVN